jgi:uncharacterized protein (TIGR00304 family)
MRLAALGAIASLVAGAVLLGDAVLFGRASLSLVLIVPVFSGSSIEFLLGVVLLILGFLLLPWAFVEPLEEERLPTAEAPPATPSNSGATGGGLVLIGPLPIFFGAWKNVSPRVRILAALVGAVLLIVLVVGVLVAVR